MGTGICCEKMITYGYAVCNHVSLSNFQGFIVLSDRP